jgi:hypothetical protein
VAAPSRSTVGGAEIGKKRCCTWQEWGTTENDIPLAASMTVVRRVEWLKHVGFRH